MSLLHALDLSDDGQRNSHDEFEDCCGLGFFFDAGQTDLAPMKRSAEDDLAAMEGAPEWFIAAHNQASRLLEANKSVVDELKSQVHKQFCDIDSKLLQQDQQFEEISKWKDSLEKKLENTLLEKVESITGTTSAGCSTSSTSDAIESPELERPLAIFGWDSKTDKATRKRDFVRLQQAMAIADVEQWLAARLVANYMFQPQHIRYHNAHFHLVKRVTMHRKHSWDVIKWWASLGKLQPDADNRVPALAPPPLTMMRCPMPNRQHLPTTPPTSSAPSAVRFNVVSSLNP